MAEGQREREGGKRDRKRNRGRRKWGRQPGGQGGESKSSTVQTGAHPPPSTNITTTSKCRPKKPHSPDPPSLLAQGALFSPRGSQQVHGARGSPSATVPHGPFARSLPCPSCIRVCVEGFIRVAAVVGILFSARTRGFPCCSFVGSARRRLRAHPAPSPEVSCLPPFAALLLGKLAPICRLFSCLRPLCQLPAPAYFSAAASWPARPSLTRLKSHPCTW